MDGLAMILLCMLLTALILPWVNLITNIEHKPSHDKPFHSFTQEWGQSNYPEVIFRNRVGSLL